MRIRDVLLCALFVVLSVGVAAFGARIAGHHHGTRLELGRVKLSVVDDRLRERLHSLEDPVLATYYVSPRAEMPSDLRRLEAQVTDVLFALKEASDGSFDYQILDPHVREAEEELDDGMAKPVESKNARYAARQGIAPFRVRSITRDAWSERTIWSSLTLSFGAHPPVVLNGVVPEHLPRLQATILAHLDQMEQPRRPVVALAAPERGFDLLRARLERSTDVVRFDPSTGAPFPGEADLLFWLDPGAVEPGTLRELDRFLESGRSAIVAASPLAVRIGDRAPDGFFDAAAFRVGPSGFDAETLWRHFGLEPVGGLVCDQFAVVHRAGEGEDAVATPLPFMVRCIAPNQRFALAMNGMPNGTLLFEAPTPFALDADVLADQGWTPEALAHTSDGTWIEAVPDTRERPADARALSPENGTPVSRQPLAVLLSPTDPWHGSVVAMASAACFRDDWLRMEGVAHERLVDVLVRNLTGDERLVVNRTEVARSEPVPELSPKSRGLVRGLCVFLVPALLALVALFRGTLALRIGPTGRRGLVASVAGALVLGLVLARAVGAPGWRVDLTDGGLNRLAPKTAELARTFEGKARLRAELLVSRRAKLPPVLRPAIARLEAFLDELEGAGAELELVRIPPEELSDEERDALAAEGVLPVRTTSREEGVTTVRSVYSSLRLSAGDAQELVHLPDPAAFEDLEFRVAFALWKLATGKQPTLAFASDAPRLSPAEAYTDYQTKGLFAPVGDDVYSLARQRLSEVGFRVVHVNPRNPSFPPELDALVWLQPRRETRPMIDATARILHGGGRVLLAAQFYNLQARQYRGTNFTTVYWPQPQTPDLDFHWFPELGIELVREVLFDDLKTRTRMETQVNRNSAQRDYEDQESAQPFLIRAAAANFADGPLTRGLGDLAFTWANRIRWDAERLRELGLEAEPVATTSERAWSFAWSGGYLPDEVLLHPVEGELPEKVELLSREALAVRFTGNFPLPIEPLIEGERPDTGLVERAPAPGELVLVGASEPFKNGALLDREYRSDHLLVNAAAHLALPEDLAAVAGRRRVARGFDYVGPDTRRDWRTIVWTAGPLALLLFGTLRRLVRRKGVA